MVAFLWGRSLSAPGGDTKIIHDTIRIEKPIERIVEKVRKVTIPVEVVVHDTIRDLMVRVDTVFVEAQEVRKEYKDSTYHAVISGLALGDHQPRLESIEVYNTTITQVRLKKPHFAVLGGVGVGINHKGHIQPIVGISTGVILWSR